LKRLSGISGFFLRKEDTQLRKRTQICHLED